VTAIPARQIGEVAYFMNSTNLKLNLANQNGVEQALELFLAPRRTRPRVLPTQPMTIWLFTKYQVFGRPKFQKVRLGCLNLTRFIRGTSYGPFPPQSSVEDTPQLLPIRRLRERAARGRFRR
jgi:hypothetical protein